MSKMVLCWGCNEAKQESNMTYLAGKPFCGPDCIAKKLFPQIDEQLDDSEDLP